ncbi:MAG: hypothetical protein ACRELY_08235, partial [Polyangiaceae bacterium]
MSTPSSSSGGQAPPPPPSRAAAHDRASYLRALCRTVPPTIVESVLASPTELALAQQCEGTLLNADLVGFTSFCEEAAAAGHHELEGLTTSLNKLFAKLLEEALFPYGGLVMQFGGDSVTAIFRGEDHTFRAAAAALHAQKVMHANDFDLSSTGGKKILLRVGLATGTLTMPIVGDVVRRAVICAGITAHRAVSHQRRATPGTVLADLQIAERLRDRARIGEAMGDAVVLTGLTDWPERKPLPPLPDNLADQIEAKIALLEQFVP